LVLSSEKNLYEILEIPSSASDSAIKSAYKKLVRKYHPDVNSGDKQCVKKFKEVTEAYEILSDRDKKKNYDLLRGFYKNNSAGGSQEPSQAKFSEAQRAYKQAREQEQEVKNSAKSQKETERFSHIFSDILEGFKNTTSTARNQQFKTQQVRPERGKDIHTDVKITMPEAKEGTSRTINILHTEVCPNCNGRPFANGAKCPICKGLGEQSIHKKLNVKIPANVKHGSKIRIANEGNKGYNGGKNGDLYLNIKIESNSNFKYEGLNALCTIPITPYEAVLGASIEIPTPNGRVTMKILPNTHSGQKFRLAGQGLIQEDKTGDMIVTVNIEMPKTLSKEEIKLYERLRDITKTDIRENK